MLYSIDVSTVFAMPLIIDFILTFIIEGFIDARTMRMKLKELVHPEGIKIISYFERWLLKNYTGYVIKIRTNRTISLNKMFLMKN